MEAVTGTLGLNLAGLIWHTINFLVLLFLLYRFLWNPVRGMLDARAQRVRESMEQAEQARKAAEQAEADRQALLAETRREAEQIRHRAEEQSKRIVDEAGQRADERARQILEQAEASSRASCRCRARGSSSPVRPPPPTRNARPWVACCPTCRRWCSTSWTSW